MKKITTLFIVFLLGLSSSYAQSCNDWNGYVDSKNVGPTGYYTLAVGAEELCSQTYYYSGPGSIEDVSINGQIPGGIGWWYYATIKVSIYNVDASNRPTTMVSPGATKTMIWNYWETQKDVHFGLGGIAVNDNFALVVELLGFPGQQFNVMYTGDGESQGEDLPSVAGTSTGWNWTSLDSDFGHDGDLYIYPRMNNFNTADFTPSAICNIQTGQMVYFTNQSDFTTDRMFNLITAPGYMGSEVLYDWDFGDGMTSTDENPSHSFAAPGRYTISLTTTIDDWDGLPCVDTRTMDVSVGLDVVATVTNLTCNDDNTGALVLAGSGGGNSSYWYSIDGINWQPSPNFTGLSAGTYDIYVRDGMECVENGIAVDITEPPAISIASPVGVTLATCGNADGGILAFATGGTGALEYSLDDITYQSSGSFTAVLAATYMLYVKDENACVQTRAVTVGNTTAPSLTLQSYTTVSCYGGNDGTITIIGSGGVGALQFSIDGENFQSTGVFTNLPAGIYSPSVKDAAGCIGSIPNIVITQPDAIEFSVTQTPALCFGSMTGQIDVVGVSGGTGTMTYSIDGVNYQSGTNFSTLAAIAYMVTIKDAAGCTATQSIGVGQPLPITVSVNSFSDLTCFESGDGALSVSAGGGNGGYMYTIGGSPQPSGKFSSLDAGTYTIYVVDANGCTGSTTQVISQPTKITANLTAGNSTCGNPNGTLLAVAANGSGSGYTYSIDGGVTSNGTGMFTGLAAGTYIILITDDTGCSEVFTAVIVDSDGPVIANISSTDVTCHDGDDGTISVNLVTGGTGTIEYSVDGGPYQSSNQLTGLEAGNHLVVVKDQNGCTGEYTIQIFQPASISAIVTKVDVLCFGGYTGSLTIVAGGGQGNLAYSINGVNFQSTPQFDNLPAGTYTVTVKDAGQCTVEVTTTINQPFAIGLFATALNVSCNGGSDGAINSTAIGGVGTILYSIDGVNWQTSGFFSNLPAADYDLTAKDATNCERTIAVTVTEPDALVSSGTVYNVSCVNGTDGAVNLYVTGGVAPYGYSWSNFTSGEDIFNVPAGNYTVNITDANGCETSDIFTIVEPSNPIIVNGTVTDATGVGGTDGEIDLAVTGGTPPYTYDWSTADITQDLIGLSPGTYSVEVTDANGCSQSGTFTVIAVVGLTENGIENSMIIYPNPASTILHVNFDDATSIENISLTDMTGKVIYETVPTSEETVINVAELANGMYFVNIHTKEKILTERIVINK